MTVPLSHTDSPRNCRQLKIAAWMTIGVLLMLCNVYTLALFSEDGRIDGLLRQYIWVFDAWLLLLGLVSLLRGRARRILGRVVFVLLLAGSVEVASLLAYKLTFQRWHFDDGFYGTIFEPHPWLVGVPRSGAIQSHDGKLIRHNSLGFRGEAFRMTPLPGSRRIVAIGGSSTYGVGVSEGQTWPEHLARYLGPSYEVVNFGVPGYGTAEHIIQTALLLSDLQADYVVYYTGWNDIRNMHVKNLRPDYANFHGRSQYGNLHLPPVWCGPNLASPRMLVHLLQQAGWMHRTLWQGIKRKGEVRSGIDTYALALYRRNLSLLVVMARDLGVIPVLVPQVLNNARLRNAVPYGWVPYVRDRDLPQLMEVYNGEMAEVASEKKAAFVHGILEVEWCDADFVDNGHFSDRGNHQFAEVIGRFIRAEATKR